MTALVILPCRLSSIHAKIYLSFFSITLLLING